MSVKQARPPAQRPVLGHHTRDFPGRLGPQVAGVGSGLKGDLSRERGLLLPGCVSSGVLSTLTPGSCRLVGRPWSSRCRSEGPTPANCPGSRDLHCYFGERLTPTLLCPLPSLSPSACKLWGPPTVCVRPSFPCLPSAGKLSG